MLMECIQHQEEEKGGKMAFLAEAMGQRQGKVQSWTESSTAKVRLGG